jgi:hypothetical protein
MIYLIFYIKAKIAEYRQFISKVTSQSQKAKNNVKDRKAQRERKLSMLLSKLSRKGIVILSYDSIFDAVYNSNQGGAAPISQLPIPEFRDGKKLKDFQEEGFR